MDCITQSIEKVENRVRNACVEAGVMRSSVTLLAACKTMTAQIISEAAGSPYIDCFGENRAQEINEKRPLGAYGQKPVHMIGGLQTNKVKYVTGICELIHSADSQKLLAEIDKTASSRGVTQDILAEVNIGREEGKSGVMPEQLAGFLEQASACKNLRVRGLAVIPPPSDTRAWFSKAYELFAKYRGGEFDILSMGMSADYYEAILEGSTLVRVGSAIFGARNV